MLVGFFICCVLQLLQAIRDFGQERQLQCTEDLASSPKVTFEDGTDQIIIDGYDPIEISNIAGYGNLGVVFKTRMKSNPPQEVALKFVYNRKFYEDSGKMTIRLENSSSPGYAKVSRYFQKECKNLQDIASQSQPSVPGASKILRCHQMCVGPFTEDSPERGVECQSESGNYQFIVMDFFAGDEGSDWWNRNVEKYRSEDNEEKLLSNVAEVLNQVRDGLTYLSLLEPAWIHGGLNWDKIAVKDNGPSGGHLEVRLMDFGAAMRVAPRTTLPLPPDGGSISIVPPEWNISDYSLVGYSVDAYRLGAMASDGLCGIISEDENARQCYASVWPLTVEKPEGRVKPSMVGFTSSGMTKWHNGFLCCFTPGASTSSHHIRPRETDTDEKCPQETMQHETCTSDCLSCWTRCEAAELKATPAVADSKGSKPWFTKFLKGIPGAAQAQAPRYPSYECHSATLMRQLHFDEIHSN